eukprot:scaffold109454_cov24-Tisochrysis_lutea.AAC.1
MPAHKKYAAPHSAGGGPRVGSARKAAGLPVRVRRCQGHGQGRAQDASGHHTGTHALQWDTGVWFANDKLTFYMWGCWFGVHDTKLLPLGRYFLWAAECWEREL